jgi:hypothetical protein
MTDRDAMNRYTFLWEGYVYPHEGGREAVETGMKALCMG